jgi:hypothetical protein
LGNRSGSGDTECDKGTYVGDSAREVMGNSSISDVHMVVARDTSLGLDTESIMFEGVNVSGVSMTPWNEVVVVVCSVRPRA